MLKVEIIELKDLKSFIESARFKSFKTKPISKLRALSYISNPNALPTDHVLILGFLNNELIAFRSLWRDQIYTENAVYSFGWCSGNWVHPDQRRRGYSKQLFEVAYKSWQGKLMAANLAPASRHLYLQSNLMSHFGTVDGYRFYRKSVLAKILPHRYPKLKWLKAAYNSLDQFLNMGIYPIPNDQTKKLLFESKQIDSLCKHSNSNENSLFRRNKEDFNWFWKYPWMTENKSAKEEQQSYPFSLWAEDFQPKVLQIKKANHNHAYALMIQKNKTLKLCYTSNFDSETECQSLLHHILSIDFDYLTLYDPVLIDFFKRQRKYYLYAKPFAEEFLISNHLQEQINGQSYGGLNYGDGDTVFC